MFLFGFNVLIFVFALLGGALNKLFTKNFRWVDIQSAFWFSLMLPDITDYYIYAVALILGFLTVRYCPMFGNYLAKKIRAWDYKRKGWGKFIHKE